jgi:hypothetical protein
MFTPKIHPDESSQVQISFNDIQHTDRSSTMFNPFEPRPMSQIMDNLNSQIYNDSKLKENNISSPETKSINRLTMSKFKEKPSKHTHYLDEMLPHRKHEKNGILKLINNHVVLLLYLSQKLNQVKDRFDFNNCLNCLEEPLFSQNCGKVRLFNQPELDEFLVELGGIPGGFDVPGKYFENYVDDKILENLGLVMNTNCGLDMFGFAVKEIALLWKSEKKKKKRYSSVSKSKSKKKNFRNVSKNRKKSKIQKNFSKNKKNQFMKIKNFTYRLIKWYMIKRFTNFNKIIDVRVSENDVKTFKKNIFDKRYKESRIVLIDCRYNYEFDGGHLKNAFNIIDPEVIIELFFNHSWISNKSYMDHLLTYTNNRVDLETAKNIKRKFQTSQMMNDNQNITSRINQMNQKINKK